MLKLKNSAMLVVAALCGYLALMTPDWKSELYAKVGAAYGSNYGLDLQDDILLEGAANQVYVARIVGKDVAQIHTLGTIALEDRFSGDINGDGIDDVIFRRASDGYVLRWLTTSAGYTKGAGLLLAQSPALSVVTTGDFDGDGDDDILTYFASGGYYNRWIMQAGGIVNGNYVAHWAPEQVLIGVGDTDNDGDDDIVWRRSDNGWIYIWVMEDGARAAVATVTSVNTAANTFAVADVDDDGHADIVFRRQSDGFMNIVRIQNNAMVSNNTVGFFNKDYVLKDVGDYDGDGIEDEVFMNSTVLNAARVIELDIAGFGGAPTTPSDTLLGYTINPSP